MGSNHVHDERNHHVAALRVLHDAAASRRPSHAVTARSRALLDLLVSTLEGKQDVTPPRRPRG